MIYKRLLQLGIALGLIDYLAFAVWTLMIGGNGLHVYAAHGDYLLGNSGHTAVVSKAMFLYSKWQGYGLITIFPIGLLCAWLFSRMPTDAMRA